MFNSDLEIILKDVTAEMRCWLEENCEHYTIRPHMHRFRWAGPRVLLKDCQRQEGYEIQFDCTEMAMAFKLRWT